MIVIEVVTRLDSLFERIVGQGSIVSLTLFLVFLLIPTSETFIILCLLGRSLDSWEESIGEVS